MAVQRSTFDLVVRIAEKHVSDLVVEVELETESPPTIALPDELMNLLGDKLPTDLKDTPTEFSKVRSRSTQIRCVPVEKLTVCDQASTYILAWLVTFRFFESAVGVRLLCTRSYTDRSSQAVALQSPRIKSAYNDQIRRAALIPDSFLPSIFGLLNLSDRTRATDISPWGVDEFHLDCKHGETG